MQKFEKLINLAHGHTHSKFKCLKLSVADINQDHSQTISLAAATSDSQVTPALSDFMSAGFTRLGVSETIL